MILVLDVNKDNFMGDTYFFNELIDRLDNVIGVHEEGNKYYISNNTLEGIKTLAMTIPSTGSAKAKMKLLLQDIN